ncbi:hypothetical protein V502_08877 [Pseudogymnoascus sp. VKM F-4520 (FW-2644)]|nr:hypothetical protein V502_08877 [Pseudogymnoascus sp. VKM F-4520 (FW-2644)]
MKFSVLTTVATILAASTSVSALPTSESASMAARAELESRATCSKAATDKLIFKVSINSFEMARKAKNPSKCNWSSDGCSWSPDKLDGYNFIPSCHRHDFGYRNTKSQKRFTKAMKKKIDDNFKKDLYHYCAQFSGLSSWKGVECRRLADIYVAFVRKYGKRDQIGDVAFSKREENIFDIDLDEDIEGQEIPDLLPEEVEGGEVDGISKREEDIFDITADEDIEEVDEISKREEDTALNIALDEDIEGQEIPDVLPEDVEGDEVEDIDAYLGEEEE